MPEPERLEPFEVESVSVEAMRTLAALLRDPTPIHFDPEAVAELGLGDRVINQGPANMGYVINALIGSGRRLERLEVDFRDNVRGGDRVQAGGERVGDAADEREQWEVWLDVDGGARALTGRAVTGPDGGED